MGTAEEKDLMYELAKALNVPVHHFEEDAGYMDYINPYKILKFINQFKSEVCNPAKELLKKYEQWEADLLMLNEVWENGLPQFTQELYDKWMKLQTERNKILNTSEPE